MKINTEKRIRLEVVGFKVGSVEEFLDLTSEEHTLVEVSLALSDAFRQQRTTHHLSEAALAKRLQPSQFNIAKGETGDFNVSLDPKE